MSEHEEGSVVAVRVTLGRRIGPEGYPRDWYEVDWVHSDDLDVHTDETVPKIDCYADGMAPWPDAERMALLETALRDEQDALWSDLDDALADAQGVVVRFGWSMRCDWLCHRLRHVAGLIGWSPRTAVKPHQYAVYDALVEGRSPHVRADPALATTA